MNKLSMSAIKFIRTPYFMPLLLLEAKTNCFRIQILRHNYYGSYPPYLFEKETEIIVTH